MKEDFIVNDWDLVWADGNEHYRMWRFWVWVNSGVNNVVKGRVIVGTPTVGHGTKNVLRSFEFFVDETSEFKGKTMKSALFFVIGKGGFELGYAFGG